MVPTFAQQMWVFPLTRWYALRVPLGLKRYQQSGQSHFVTFSCYRRLPYLTDPARRDVVLACLGQTRRRYSLRVYGYVVMPEHVHVLVSEPEAKLLANAILSLKIAVARRVSRAPDAPRERGSFWQKRYYDHNVRRYKSFAEKLRYIHRNAVKRGLCIQPEDWGLEQLPPLLDGRGRRAGNRVGVDGPPSSRNRPTFAAQMWGTLRSGIVSGHRPMSNHSRMVEVRPASA